MISIDPQFKQDLTAWLEQHSTLTEEVCVLELGGRLCVIKLRRPSSTALLSYAIRYMRASLISALCWWGFKERPSARVLLRNGVEDETLRLLKLHKHGYPVPEVLHHEPGILVLAFVGESLPDRLRQCSPDERLIWMDRAARDLAAFHAAGFVHGGAQLRNLMVQGERITRIDFEENIAEALSLTLGQAYDVYQMMSSMAGLSGAQFTEGERRQLCQRLLDAYLETNPDATVKARLARLGYLFSRIQKYTGWLLRRLPGRDVRGFLYVTDTLRL